MKDFCQFCDLIAFFKFRNFERYSCSTENFENCFQQLDAKITLKQFPNAIKSWQQYLQIAKNKLFPLQSVSPNDHLFTLLILIIYLSFTLTDLGINGLVLLHIQNIYKYTKIDHVTATG